MLLVKFQPCIFETMAVHMQQTDAVPASNFFSKPTEIGGLAPIIITECDFFGRVTWISQIILHSQYLFLERCSSFTLTTTSFPNTYSYVLFSVRKINTGQSSPLSAHWRQLS